ncbi:hypothetical protein B0T10DRAFT_290568 [Thelonectria olida]|uniref:Secreted protein n=1 Tax=Thelonectria olida TaxID=1576542 RepID=A0A9P8W6B7_9HYPO|nr:hypothetical protein B0T10DRAFT_290568 [Thelonectria olida]
MLDEGIPIGYLFFLRPVFLPCLTILSPCLASTSHRLVFVISCCDVRNLAFPPCRRVPDSRFLGGCGVCDLQLGLPGWDTVCNPTKGEKGHWGILPDARIC